MNFLAHLWLADQAQLPLAGAILGDWVRGALPADMPGPLAASVQLHRSIDARTDQHPCVDSARRSFGPGRRRYAGIVLDILFDHALATDWAHHSVEPLTNFVDRAAQAVAGAAAWFERAGARAPQARPFAALLLSYSREDGIDVALQRTAARLREPRGLLDAAQDWRERMPALRRDLPLLLADLEHLGAVATRQGPR